MISSIILFAAVAGGIQIRLEDYGGVGDGETDNTDAFTLAIGAIRAGGGGILSVGPGRFVSFPFNLTSRMTLQLQSDTSIIARTCAEALADPMRWPALPPLPNYGRDHDIGAASRYQSFVHAEDVEQVAIIGRGPSSVIDGRGEDWWKAHGQRSLTVPAA
jgi:polygalacturonase